MQTTLPQPIRLADYAPPTFLVDTVDLDIDIHAAHTRVRATLALRRNPAADPHGALVLDGDGLSLHAVLLGGVALAPAAYVLTADTLRVPDAPACCTLTTEVILDPTQNTQLMGLYASHDGYFTQCEAEGFRRITWFPDRPDVMARYTTRIHADRARFPILLSNGNLAARGEEAGGRHWARWVDPFPKPSYLFAMVAARLDRRATEFTTASGRRVELAVYVEPGKLDQTAFALDALQSAMRWDEETFGLELDLDQYTIVAVGDFNMGAMENKGLNIFNTKYVLARADTATDTDYMMLDRVVAHEYFHNWTGNRVTCRDWFQLSLKEGLTVFRDQQYGGDRYSHALQRIQEVRTLRATQFPEDAGPMAHPVRPASYIEISNFYTATVYNKGAEVVRMIHTLLGAEAFRRGMDLYFARHDGQAVRIEEFIAAMQDASGIDLAQFGRWYDQAGTPVLDSRGEYDAATQRYTLHLRQHCPATPDGDAKLPFHLPIALGLVAADGHDLPLRLAGEAHAGDTTRVLSLTAAAASFTFVDVSARPVPSLLRDFSAPVILRHDHGDADLAHLMAYDSDPFNRWEAGQRLAVNVLVRAIEDRRDGRPVTFPDAFIAACARLLADAPRDPAFAAEALSLPQAGYLAEQFEIADPDAIFAVRTALRRLLAERLRTQWIEAYETSTTPGPYRPEPGPAGRRALRNLALGFLMELDDPAWQARCFEQFEAADNMTDTMAALVALANADCPARRIALERFERRWRDEELVLDKWFAVQAGARLPGTLGEVRALLAHPAFDLRNPNRVRALIGGFCHGNHLHFHAADGSGYAFAADQVLALDPINAQIAARLARAFDRWRKFDADADPGDGHAVQGHLRGRRPRARLRSRPPVGA